MAVSLRRRLKGAANGLLALADAEIVRRSEHTRAREERRRHALRGALEHARRLGFSPATVIDVGAATGTAELYEVFPAADHVFIEPLEEHRAALEQIAATLDRAEVVIAAVTKDPGNVVLNVHPDLYGSSLYREEEDSDVNGSPRSVTALTLDQICSARSCKAPYLIKVDVQGAELDVLAGAQNALAAAEYVVVEASLFRFFHNGPQLMDVLVMMREKGFVVYEFLDYNYRPLDGAMSQVDIAFVKEEGVFRRQHFYATPQQRQEQTEAIQRYLQARKKTDEAPKSPAGRHDQTAE